MNGANEPALPLWRGRKPVTDVLFSLFPVGDHLGRRVVFHPAGGTDQIVLAHPVAKLSLCGLFTGRCKIMRVRPEAIAVTGNRHRPDRFRVSHGVSPGVPQPPDGGRA
ncbi:hypothetical protein L1887_43544 [Cichorium endivia]|nr:hypothetical protein L1887_43544 [Cichorium endivia]